MFPTPLLFQALEFLILIVHLYLHGESLTNDPVGQPFICFPAAL